MQHGSQIVLPHTVCAKCCSTTWLQSAHANVLPPSGAGIQVLVHLLIWFCAHTLGYHLGSHHGCHRGAILDAILEAIVYVTVEAILEATLEARPLAKCAGIAVVVYV